MSDKESNYSWLALVTNEEFIQLVQQYGVMPAVKKWSNANPTIPREELKKAGNKIAQLSSVADKEHLSPAIKKQWWQNIEEQTIKKNQNAPVTKNLWMKWSIAASVALLLGVGYVFYQKFSWTKIQMDVAERTNIDLPDGSHVRINASSEISYHRSSFQEDRLVRLKGEAFFEVTEGTSFTVETSAGKVLVLGTAFNVRQRDNLLQVACQSGKVEVHVAKNQRLVLTEGEAAHYTEIDQELKGFRIQNPQDIASWREGEYMLYDVKFEEAIRELERQFDVRVEVPHTIEAKTGNFYFTGSHIDSALYQLSWPLNADFRKIKNDNYEIFIKK